MSSALPSDGGLFRLRWNPVVFLPSTQWIASSAEYGRGWLMKGISECECFGAAGRGTRFAVHPSFERIGVSLTSMAWYERRGGGSGDSCDSLQFGVAFLLILGGLSHSESLSKRTAAAAMGDCPGYDAKRGEDLWFGEFLRADLESVADGFLILLRCGVDGWERTLRMLCAANSVRSEDSDRVDIGDGD